MVYTEEPNPVISDREVEVRALGGARVVARGARAARCRLWRVAAAEAAGTALLVALTCLPACAGQSAARRALTAGLVVAALVQSFDHVSGAHFNPTVTLTALLARRVGGAQAAAALAAQLAGGALGGALLTALAPAALPYCITRPAPELSVYQALGVEGVLGAVLALVNLAAWDARNRAYGDSWPLRIGLSVAALSLAANDLTGASANPVRSAAPALFAGDFAALWVYCVGPPSGACASCALYATLWRTPAAPRPAAATPPAHKLHATP